MSDDPAMARGEPKCALAERMDGSRDARIDQPQAKDRSLWGEPAGRAEHKQRTADHVARLVGNAEKMAALQTIGSVPSFGGAAESVP
jgi:hypothetical protein